MRNPVETVGAETKALFELEFLGGSDESERALLYEIKVRDATALVASRYGIHQAQVVHDQLVPGVGVEAQLSADGLHDLRFDHVPTDGRVPLTLPVGNGVGNAVGKLPPRAPQHRHRHPHAEACR